MVELAKGKLKTIKPATSTKRQQTKLKVVRNLVRVLKNKKEQNLDASSCAIKINRIPYGFFEPELLKYFIQFGRVRRVRVARSKKTGNHRGWAFVQFTDPIVAQIAAETMNGYLMFNKILSCRVLKNFELPKCLSKGKPLLGRPSKYATARRHTRKATAEKTKAQIAAAKARLLSALKKKNKKFAAMGIDYEFQIPSSKKVNVSPVKKEDGEHIEASSNEQERVAEEVASKGFVKKKKEKCKSAKSSECGKQQKDVNIGKSCKQVSKRMKNLGNSGNGKGGAAVTSRSSTGRLLKKTKRKLEN